MTAMCQWLDRVLVEKEINKKTRQVGSTFPSIPVRAEEG